MSNHARIEDVPWEFEEPAPIAYGDEDLELSIDEGEEFDEEAFEAAFLEEQLKLGILPLDPGTTKTPLHGKPHQIDGRIKRSQERDPANDTSTTVGRFAHTDTASGERIYDESRKPTHDDVIQSMLRMNTSGNPCAGCPKHTTPTGRPPEAFFTAGADAQTVNDHPDRPEKAIVLDPRIIARALPEAGEGEDVVMEEAEDIAGHLADEIQKQGLDVIVVGDDAPSDEHMQQYMAAGYSYPKVAQSEDA